MIIINKLEHSVIRPEDKWSCPEKRERVPKSRRNRARIFSDTRGDASEGEKSANIGLFLDDKKMSRKVPKQMARFCTNFSFIRSSW